MKEEDLIRSMLAARVKYYRTITYVLLGLLTFCVGGLVGTIYLPTHTEPEVLTVLITFTTGLVTAMIAIVTQGMQAARRLRSDEEIQKQVEEIEARRVTGKDVKLPIEGLQHKRQEPPTNIKNIL